MSAWPAAKCRTRSSRCDAGVFAAPTEALEAMKISSRREPEAPGTFYT
jgi:hypothetical protein